jgi:hypothetical protein
MINAAKLDQPHTAIRRFIATLTAAATVLAMLTATAAPARADNDDIAKALAAIAAIAIIGKVINDKKDRKRDAVVSHPQPDDRYGRDDRDGRRDDRSGGPRRYEDRRFEDRHYEDRRYQDWSGRETRSLRLPATCAIEVNGRHDRSTTVYSARCLNRERFEGRLPRHCAIDIRVRGRDDRVYDQNCLIDAGFRVGRQRYGDS